VVSARAWYWAPSPPHPPLFEICCGSSLPCSLTVSQWRKEVLYYCGKERCGTVHNQKIDRPLDPEAAVQASSRPRGGGRGGKPSSPHDIPSISDSMRVLCILRTGLLFYLHRTDAGPTTTTVSVQSDGQEKS